MRKIDKHKTAFEKAAKTISFEKPVLDKLEERARKLGTTASKLCNSIVKDKIMLEEEYWSFMAKEYNLKMQEALWFKDQAKIKRETK